MRTSYDTNRTIFKIAIAYIAVAVIYLLIFHSQRGTDSTQEAPPTPTTPTLRAAATVTSASIRITNNNSFAYSNCTAIIHQGFGGYAYTITEIAPDKTVSIPLSEFTDGSNQRFNSLSTKVVEVTMECTGKGEQRFIGWRF